MSEDATMTNEDTLAKSLKSLNEDINEDSEDVMPKSLKSLGTRTRTNTPLLRRGGVSFAATLAGVF
jgi:hypothetical protein